MEFGGIALFVAIVLGGVFALPRIIDRRKAISSSREGDRFSADMSLVEQPDANEALHADSLNSQNLKLLPNATPKSGTLLAAAGGTMSNSAPKSVHTDKYPAGYQDENQVENKAAGKAEVQVEAKVEAGAERASSSGAARQEAARKAKSKRSARLTGSSSHSDASEAGDADSSKVGANSSARAKSAGARVEPSRSKISREISQLRSQRAGRLARESAAGQRRLVTSGISLALLVVIGVIAAATELSWWWVAVPAVFLAATLGFSVRAGKDSMRQSEAEEERFAELKAKLLGNSAGQAGSSSGAEAVAESAAAEYASKRKAARQSMNKSVRKSSSRRAGERPSSYSAEKRFREQADRRTSERIGRKATGKVNRPDAALETEEASVAAVKTENISAASRVSGAPEISGVDAASTSVLAAATDDAAAADVSTISIANASTSSVENLPAASAVSGATSSADAAPTSKTSAKTSSASRKASADSQVAEARRERSWSVGKLPQPSYAMKERVRGRAVHIDTDINPLVKLDDAVAQVPGRPVAVGQGSLRELDAVSEIAAAATAADFAAAGAERRGYGRPSSSAKIDLEAILEQRRAQ